MSASPKFCITDVGLAAASVATPTGPFVEIAAFKVGSAFGYEPQPEDLDINGALLYEGEPTSYQYVGDNTINIICKIPADAGPFEFGEVAVYLTGGAMFAKAAFEFPQTKFTSLGTNLLSTYTFNCLLKLAQSVAVFSVVSVEIEPSIWEVDLWSDIYPPALSANPSIPAILVRELDSNGESSLVHQASPTHWTMGTNYKLYAKKAIDAADVDYIEILKTDLDPSVVTAVNRLFVVETEDGYFRSVSSVVSSGLNYRFNLNLADLPGVPTGDCWVYKSAMAAAITLELEGDVTGSATLTDGTVTLTTVLTMQTRQIEYSTPGAISFTVPDGVTDIYVDGCAAGGGGGGAGGGRAVPYSGGMSYPGLVGNGAGGGGGGGGVGAWVLSYHMAVTPGQVITGATGAGGSGGAGGALDVIGTTGSAGANTTFGALTLIGGAGGGPGAEGTGGGGGGGPGAGGHFGTDGNVGGAGGNGGSGPFGIAGPGPRAGTGIGDPGSPGGNATGYGAGGGGGGSPYGALAAGGDGGDGSPGFLRVRW